MHNLSRTLPQSFPFTLFELERWELEGRRGIHFEIRTRKKSSAALQTHLLPWSDVLEFKTSLRAEKATETTHGIPPCLAAEDAPLSRPRSPDRPAISSPVPSPVSAGTKRSRESLEEITPNAKRVKVLQFHPDTNDNGLWATGRPFMRRCHQPTPCSIRGGDDGTDTAEEERQHQWPTADFAMVVASNLPGATAFPQGAP